MENGGPTPEGITNNIYENTKTIKEYLIADLPDVLAESYSVFLNYQNYLFHVEFFYIWQFIFLFRWISAQLE